MTHAPKRKKSALYVKGFACPTCVGVRLHVIRTSRPIRGLIVRYRKCAICGHKSKTEERLSKDGYEDAHNPPK